MCGLKVHQNRWVWIWRELCRVDEEGFIVFHKMVQSLGEEFVEVPSGRTVEESMISNEEQCVFAFQKDNLP